MAKFNPQSKATCWSVTINNPTDQDEDNINEARLRGWSVEGQKERGVEGTEHYQLMLKTPQVRGSAVKKMFPRAHIEIAVNPTALKKYVHKEETRIGEVNGDNEFYPSPTKFMGLFANWINGDGYKPSLARYGKSYHEMDGDELLHVFDDCIRSLISDGYFVEAYGVNPQVRGSVKRYGQEIIFRELNKLNKKDAQDEENHSKEESVSSQDGERAGGGEDVC